MKLFYDNNFDLLFIINLDPLKCLYEVKTLVCKLVKLILFITKNLKVTEQYEINNAYTKRPNEIIEERTNFLAYLLFSLRL